MKILWIPMDGWLHESSTTDKRFVSELKKRHTIHVLCWETHSLQERFNPLKHLKALLPWSKKESGLFLHKYPRLLFSARFRPFRKINNILFNRAIKNIVEKNAIDVIVCSPNYTSNGLPSFNFSIPFVFFYTDFVNEFTRKTYLAKADAVLCVSKSFQEQAKLFNPSACYLPNPIESARLKKGNGAKIRKKLGLEGKKVIGTIGMGPIESPFIMDSIEQVCAKEPNAVFLFVGEGPVVKEMKKKNNGKAIFVPSMPYKKIADYFAALDIGLYCSKKDNFTEYACPIKVLEYAACKKPTVCTDLLDVRAFGFPNVLFAQPNAKDFAEKIVQGLNQKFSFPDMQQFELSRLSKKLEKILQEAVSDFPGNG